MNMAGHLGVVEAFEAVWRRKATPEEAARLRRVQDILGVRENDAIMVVMLALEHYQGLYSAMPGRIEEASRAAVGEVLESAERIANAAVRIAHNDLADHLGEAVNQVAANAARKQQWRWLGAGIGIAAIGFLLTGWLAFQHGKEAGLGSGYAAARHEFAAASWANTPEGQLAYRLALAGSLQQVARCTQPGWKVSKGACLPLANSDGTTYGWVMP